MVRKTLLTDSQRRLGKLRNMPKTVRKKSNKLLFSWTLMAFQVRHTLFDREADETFNPGRIWRISGTCQNGHGTKPAASPGGQESLANRKMSVTARSKFRSICSEMPLPSGVCCWVIWSECFELGSSVASNWYMATNSVVCSKLVVVCFELGHTARLQGGRKFDFLTFFGFSKTPPPV